MRVLPVFPELIGGTPVARESGHLAATIQSVFFVNLRALFVTVVFPLLS